MKFLLDESADLPLADFLSDRGHDVKSIVRDYPRSLSDREVLALAVQEERILITNDRDFGELIVQSRLDHTGVIYFRLGEESIPTKLEWLARVLAEQSHQLDHFITVTNRRIRVRRPPRPSR
ncbi:MAG: DUF5615 family PIN-like protein [Chloroflexi bacterium]|nr:DUF5615 family PIN-like protein [Chloroflexota bacterium]